MTKAGGSKEMKGLMGALTGHDTRLVQQLAVRCADIQATLETQLLVKDFVHSDRWWEQEADSDHIQLLKALEAKSGELTN